MERRRAVEGTRAGIGPQSLAAVPPMSAGTSDALPAAMLTKNKNHEIKDRFAQLKHRVEARRQELLAKLSGLKADTRKEAAASRDAVQHTLTELETHIKDGWENLTDAAKEKLNTWLDN
jgi:hypothetical protein